ncbi:MAG: helix-turn-helix domain-containing protein [Actinomycetota bacterium]|nr:helix-turn-helix domain-containing protein [Actinomycetota bacterium]
MDLAIDHDQLRIAQRAAATATRPQEHLGDALATALGPLLDRLGAHLVERRSSRPDDVTVALPGGPVLYVRLQPASVGTGPAADLTDGLSRLIRSIETELGAPLRDLPTRDKQHAVRLLHERGAFTIRRSADTVAEALGVTRFTVYKYLNRSGPSSA